MTFRYKITEKIKITENASKFIVHANQVTRGNFMAKQNVLDFFFDIFQKRYGVTQIRFLA